MPLSSQVLLQLTADGVCLSGVYALLAVSWALIFNTTRVFHVAHGVTLALGGYLTVQLSNQHGLPPVVSILVASIVCGVLGLVMQVLLYSPLRRRQITGMATFVASLGAMLLGIALIILKYGPNPLILTQLGGVYSIGSLRLTSAQVLAGGLGAVLTITFLIAWQTTWFGRVLRAVISNPDAAQRVGINVRRQYLIAMGVGSVLGGLAGGLLSLSQGASSDFALNGILLAAIALLVGGIGSVPGAALGGVLLALVMDVGIWPLSSQWQYSIAFGLLMVVLLVRPRGLFGERLAQADL
jgi:branched-chain amino acid transport system permease protein